MLSKQKPPRSEPRKPVAGKTALAAPHVYRPQLKAKTLQRKVVANPFAPINRVVSAPPVYKPQPTPKVLQCKQPAAKVPARPTGFSRIIQRALSSTRVSVKPWDVRLPEEVPNWKSKNTAGHHDSNVSIKIGGEGEMYATVYVAGLLPGSEVAIQGEFSTGLHAEMAALQNACQQGYRLDQVSRIVIGKAPCHRCAVVLNVLGLAGKVVYKNSGQKEYNTWGFPNLAGWNVSRADMLQLGFEDTHSTTQLISHFSGSKWW